MGEVRPGRTGGGRLGEKKIQGTLESPSGEKRKKIIVRKKTIVGKMEGAQRGKGGRRRIQYKGDGGMKISD